MTVKAERSTQRRAQQLLRGLSLSRDEIDYRLRQAIDPGFWRELYPHFSIAAEPAMVPDLPPLDTDVLGRYARGLDQHGYFQSDSPLVEGLTAPLLACVETVRTAGWP